MDVLKVQASAKTYPVYVEENLRHHVSRFCLVNTQQF